jgi:hypothetical protein
MAYENYLVFHASGAGPSAISRGLEAAKQFFLEENVDPWAAFCAFRKRENWDLNGFDEELEPSDEDYRLMNVWDQARDIAVAACFPAHTVGAHDDAFLDFDSEAHSSG